MIIIRKMELTDLFLWAIIKYYRYPGLVHTDIQPSPFGFSIVGKYDAVIYIDLPPVTILSNQNTFLSSERYIQTYQDTLRIL